MSTETQTLDCLERGIEKIWELGVKAGLDPFPTHFEKVPAEVMYEFAAYGIPGRYSHWTFGRDYQQVKTRYDYGVSKIYELVINTNPAYAFLLENNPDLQNIVVAAHVMAHVDFFKNNASYKNTRRDMVEIASLHADRIKQYTFKYGKIVVEDFLDSVRSIEFNIDPELRYERSDYKEYEKEGRRAYEDDIRLQKKEEDFDDLFDIGKKKEEVDWRKPLSIPWRNEQDLLWFIAQRSPLLKDPINEWKRDILTIVREEQLYFWPQRLTNIMNEGWATFWHQKLTRQLFDEVDFLDSGDFIEYDKMNAGVLQAVRGQGNSYLIGVRIWEDIERKYLRIPLLPGQRDLDRFGEPKKTQYNLSIFEVRSDTPTDQSFLRNYLADYLIEPLDLFIYGIENGKWVVKEKDPEKVRNKLVNSLTNMGQPVIKVVSDGGKDELILRHFKEENDLDIEWAKKVITKIEKNLWGKPVHIITETADEVIEFISRSGAISEKKEQKPKISIPPSAPATWTKKTSTHPFSFP